jgi:acetyltransferase-like isoleucine patch superfamily enzyme
MGSEVYTVKDDRFQDWEYPEIEEGRLTKYNWLVQHKENLRLGYKTDIGAFTYINAKNGVIIEDFVQIGSHCAIYSVSTIDNKEGKVILKKNCKIGSHSVIMPGVTIGENSIIGAFSFVNKDIPDNVMAVGVPAKIVKKIPFSPHERREE